MEQQIETGHPAAAQLSRHYPEITNWRDLPHLQLPTVGSTEYHYVRGKGQQRFGSGSLHKFGEAGSPAWIAEYDARVDALKASAADVEAMHSGRKVIGKKRLAPTAPGSLGHAVEAYLVSDDFTKSRQFAAKSTRGMKTDILRRWCKEPVEAGSSDVWGQAPIAEIDAEALEGLLLSYKNTHGKARNFRAAIRPFYAWLYERKMIPTRDKDGKRIINPTLLLQVPKRPEDAGLRPLTADELKACQRTWAPGTYERAAVELMFQLGPACADVIRLGPANVKTDRDGNRVCAYHRQKIRNPNKGNAYPPFRSSLEDHFLKTLPVQPLPGMPWLLDKNGRPWTDRKDAANEFSKWVIRRVLGKAGVVDGSAHGFRKLSAIEAAYRKMDLWQMKSVFGWDTLAMPSYYTQLANAMRFGFQAANDFADGWEPEDDDEAVVKTGE